MASNAGIFLAGVGTTFMILGAGFVGGLMMATSALKEPTEYQKRASAEPPSPARIILPSTAEAAQPPQESQQIATLPERPLPPPLQPAKAAHAPVEGSSKTSTPGRLKRNNGSVASGTQNAKQSGRQKELNASNR